MIFYALCGGTDFYWTGGANYWGEVYRPMTTSYAFEELGTDFGFLFYKTRVPGSLADPIRAAFDFSEVRDRANVFLDGKPLGTADAAVDVPAFHLFEFACDDPEDSFLKFPGVHGLAWVNGKPVGRYWNIGPGDALYIPASYLKNGGNRLVVFETDKLNGATTAFGGERKW